MQQSRKAFKTIFFVKVRASFTLEAAVIVPLCMVLLLACVFLGFSMHDRLAIKACGTEIAINNAEAEKAEKALSAGTGKQEIQARILAAKDAGFAVSSENGTITVNGVASFPLPLFLLRQFFGGEAGQIATELSVSHLDARAEILTYKAAADGMETAGFINAKGDAKK